MQATAAPSTIDAAQHIRNCTVDTLATRESAVPKTEESAESSTTIILSGGQGRESITNETDAGGTFALLVGDAVLAERRRIRLASAEHLDQPRRVSAGGLNLHDRLA